MHVHIGLPPLKCFDANKSPICLPGFKRGLISIPLSENSHKHTFTYFLRIFRNSGPVHLLCTTLIGLPENCEGLRGNNEDFLRGSTSTACHAGHLALSEGPNFRAGSPEIVAKLARKSAMVSVPNKTHFTNGFRNICRGTNTFATPWRNLRRGIHTECV